MSSSVTRRLNAASHPAIEALESRTLLSHGSETLPAITDVPGGQHLKLHPASLTASSHAAAAQGKPAHRPKPAKAPKNPAPSPKARGDATQIVHGVLHITGTQGNDVIRIELDPHDATKLDVIVNGVATAHNLAALTGVRIDSGQGNDDVEVNELNGAITLPMTLIGGNGNDTLVGGSGNDLIHAGNGNDLLAGEAGNDTLIAGNGTDRLLGGEGDDLLVAGKGQDTLSGDGGADTLIAGNAADDLQPGPDGVIIAHGASGGAKAGDSGDSAKTPARLHSHGGSGD